MELVWIGWYWGKERGRSQISPLEATMISFGPLNLSIFLLVKTGVKVPDIGSHRSLFQPLEEWTTGETTYDPILIIRNQ